MDILSLDWVMQVTGNLERDKSVEQVKSNNKKRLPKDGEPSFIFSG